MENNKDTSSLTPILKRKGTECIASFTTDEVVNIVTFENKLIIATKHGVYQYPEDENANLNNNPL